MLFNVLHKITGKILFQFEAESIKLCLEAAVLSDANLRDANLRDANLCYADLRDADLRDADLCYADLRGANLRDADLRDADLCYADLRGADLRYADLCYADLRGANLCGAENMVKRIGIATGNTYWKRFGKGLENNGYRFFVGTNELRDGETFASDDRVTCSHPGFHFASRSWCAVNYPDRPLEAKIRIPEGAQINEPWATDGKASADQIDILQVFDVATGEDVTEAYRIN